MSVTACPAPPLTRLIAIDKDPRFAGLRETSAGDPEASEADAQPCLIAADGSYHVAYGKGGYGWIGSDGKFGFNAVEFALSSFDAEVIAIGRAVRAHPGVFPLRILTDSLDAIAAIKGDSTGRRTASGKVGVAVERIRRSMRYRDIELTWVRGHNGLAMNELADRLARHARLSSFHKIPRSISEETAKRIAEELTPADLSHAFSLTREEERSWP